MPGTIALRVLAPFAFAIFATAALAHARLVKADPPVGGTIATSPKEIRLKFSEGVEPRFSGAALVDSAGAAIATEKPTLDPADPAVLVTPLSQPLKPGVYKVTWHAVSVDTHQTQGEFTFTVAP
ncbi:MAG TPA: copper homeostasis periplasmic binding protein CopC [Roseiarcus sp.]|nr:copper homeostasis periplasmic binding protein CopC [Roseiarcus sp.]